MTKKLCKNCEHFSPDDGEFFKKHYPGRGSCSSGKLLDGPPEDGPYQSDTAYGGGYDGYGDYIVVGENFGCIHFSKKQTT